MTLADLIDNLPNLTPVRASYTHETWAERPATRGSYSSLRISEILAEKDYPSCKDV